MPSTKARRRTAALAVSTVGILLALPMLPASAGLVPNPYVQISPPELVGTPPTVDPGPVLSTVYAAAANIEHQVTLNAPGTLSTPVDVNPYQDPTAIQVWDYIQPPIQVSPEQTVLAESDRRMMAAEGEDGGGCAGWYYDPDTNYGARPTIRHHGTTYVVNNNTDRDGTITIGKSETMSGSVTISASAEVSVSDILASVKATFGVSVTASFSWDTSTSYAQPAEAHKMTHLSGGIYGYTTQGHYYHRDPNCVIDDDKATVTAFTPQEQTDVYDVWTTPVVPSN